MSSVITDQGFILQSFDDKIEEFKEQFRAVFGAECDLSDESIIGILNSIEAERFQNAELLAQSLQSQFDPDQAQGIFLDFILSLTLDKRLPASPTIVICSCVGADGTQLTKGSSGIYAAMSSGQYQFSLDNDTIIDFENAVESYYSVSSVQDSTNYTLTIDTTDYTYTSDSSATETEIITGLRNAVNAGSQNVSAELVNNSIHIFSDDYTTPFKFYTSTANLSLDECGTITQFSAVKDGATIVPAGGIDTIVTAVSGWNSVNNPLPGTTGRLTETDDEARERRGNNSQVSECGTDAGIQKAIYQNVSGVASALVKSNRESTTDADGIPANRFLSIVSGGLDQEIVDSIFNAQPAGIKSYGNTSGTVIDGQGISQTIYFSRPVPRYVWCDIEIDIDADFPSTGEDAIKEQILTDATTLFGIGDDGKIQLLFDACYSVAGVLKVNSFKTADQLSLTPAPVSGDYSENNIDVTLEEILVFAIDRMTITTV